MLCFQKLCFESRKRCAAVLLVTKVVQQEKFEQ